MIPLLLLTLTLVAILAYLMGYHDGHRRNISETFTQLCEDLDWAQQSLAVRESECQDLTADYTNVTTELASLRFDYDILLANHNYLLWERGAGQSEGSIQ